MSKPALPMADRIMKRVRAQGRGWVFTPRHFVDFGARGAVDMALSRLAKALIHDIPTCAELVANIMSQAAQVRAKISA